MKIKEDIEEIIQKYDCGEYYALERNDDNEIDFNMEDELKKYCEDAGIDYEISFEDGFSSHGYDNNFLAIAWIEDGKIQLKTILFENY